jgi:hypothetical protein
MMNKKLIALFVAIATVSAVSAHYGNCYNCGPVEGTVDTTVDVADETVGGAADVTLGAVGPIFGGRNIEERREDREARRENRRADRQQRRAERRNR